MFLLVSHAANRNLLLIFELLLVLELDESPRVDLTHVFAESDGLLNTIGILLVIAEDGTNLFVQAVASIPDEQDLEGLLDGYRALEGLIVHEELGQVEQLAGFQADGVGDATLVHGAELLAGHQAIEVVINLPNDEVHLGLGGLAAKELQDAGQVDVGYLILVGFSLVGGIC